MDIDDIQLKICEVEPQQPFISGYVNSNEKSILKINPVGKVTSHQKIEQIEIEYADRGIHGKEIIQNKSQFNLADINEKGFVLAYTGKQISIDEYMDEANQEQYKPLVYFKSTEFDNEWTFEMEEGKMICQVVLSNQFLAILMNDDEIKVYTLGGTEIFNFQSNNVITLAIFQHVLTVVSAQSLPYNGRQNLMAETFDIKGGCLIGSSKVNISPFSQLTFLNYSDDGILYSQDGKGVIRMQVAGQYWMNVFK